MTSRERIGGGQLTDEKARELLFYLIGFFQLEENPRFDKAIDMFFDGPLKTSYQLKEDANEKS